MYKELENTKVNFDKLRSSEGEPIVPAIIVDRLDLALGKIGCVRMIGFMNREALNVTQDSGLVTFYSRDKKELWQKGQTSGNVLNVVGIYIDCDDDSLLITVDASGTTCHTGTNSCFEQ